MGVIQTFQGWASKALLGVDMTQHPIKIAREVVFDDEKLAQLIDRLAGPKIADLICYGSGDIIRKALKLPKDEQVWSDDTRIALGECMAEVFRGLTPEQKLTLIQKIRDNWKKGLILTTAAFAGWDLQRTFRRAAALQKEREAAKRETSSNGEGSEGSGGDGGEDITDPPGAAESAGGAGGGGEG